MTDAEIKIIVDQNTDMTTKNQDLTTEYYQLKKQRDDLTAENTQLKKDKETLTAENAQLKKDRDALATEHAQLAKDFVAQAHQLEEATTINEELQAQLEASSGKPAKLPQLKIGKKTFELTSDFTWLGQIVTIEVLRESAKLAETLVKEGVGHLREVV